MTCAPASPDAVTTFELFNEKADQLLASSFFKQVSGGGAVVEFMRDSGWDSVFVGPEEESTRALVLTLRLFIQDGDGISLREMATLYCSLPVSAAVRQRFETDRSQLNAFLDSESQLAISDERALTHREILDIFVYGEHAHVNPRYRQTYEDLRTTPLFPLFENDLVKTVVTFGRCIVAVRRMNEEALAELRRQA